MARPAVKQLMGRLVPARLLRSTYVVASSAVLALVFWQWRPIPEVVWDLDHDGLRAAAWAVYVLGWLLVIAMTFPFGHAEFLGLRQAVGRGPGESTTQRVRTPPPYRLVRHPMMTGFFVVFWVTPTMTAGHLLFAALGTAYIVVGVRFEERDLAATLAGYDEYAAVTPRFLPLPVRSRRPPPQQTDQGQGPGDRRQERQDPPQRREDRLAVLLRPEQHQGET
jgi:protein-S-isoprenylcysteine O-methyltransferase Ste14